MSWFEGFARIELRCACYRVFVLLLRGGSCFGTSLPRVFM